jgi:hypothetical protein
MPEPTIPTFARNGNRNGNGLPSNFGNGARRNGNGNAPQQTNVNRVMNSSGFNRLSNMNKNGIPNYRNTNVVPVQVQVHVPTPSNSKKKSRPVKIKLLKQVIEDIKKKKLIARAKKLGGKNVVENKKNIIVKFIIKKIRPPAPKKKKNKKSVQEQAQVKDFVFKNTISVSASNGGGNQGIRPRNAQNMPRNYRNTTAVIP